MAFTRDQNNPWEYDPATGKYRTNSSMTSAVSGGPEWRRNVALTADSAGAMFQPQANGMMLFTGAGDPRSTTSAEGTFSPAAADGYFYSDSPFGLKQAGSDPMKDDSFLGQLKYGAPFMGGMFAAGLTGVGALGGAASGGGGFDLFNPSTWSNPFSGMTNPFSGMSSGGGGMPAGNLLADAGTTMTDVGGGTLGNLTGVADATYGGAVAPYMGGADLTGLNAAGMTGMQGLGAGAAGWGGYGLTAADMGGALGASGGGSGIGGMFGNLPVSSLMSLGSLASGALGAYGAQTAAGQQANAANQATQAQLGMFNTLNAQGSPYRAAGYGALGPLTAGIGLGPASGGVDTGQFTHQFNAGDLNANMAPNYEFMKQQGLGATANQLNASGGNLSGNALQGINKFAQDYAGNAYQNAFNNYNANQTNIFNRLSSIAGIGQTANAQSVSAGGSISPGISQSIQTMGGAQASGTAGMFNNLSGGINNSLGWFALPQILKG